MSFSPATKSSEETQRESGRGTRAAPISLPSVESSTKNQQLRAPLQLTAEQRAVIDHHQGHALVFAVAGSGKSTALIERTAALIDRGVPPRQILLTTFGRDARAELQRRLQARLGDHQVQVMTIHALASRIITVAREAGLTQMVNGPEGFGSRLFEEVRQELVQEGKRQLRELQSHPARQSVGGEQRFAYLRGLVSAWQGVSEKQFNTYLGQHKGQRLAAPEKPENAMQHLHKRFEQRRIHAQWLDHDDVINHACELLEGDHGLQQTVSRYKQVMVDEFQDVSAAQAALLEFVTQHADCYMAIGDDDQTIYQWRGASPQMILNFEQEHMAKVYKLSINWRCPIDVTALARDMIKDNTRRAEKSMHAAVPRAGLQIHEQSDIGMTARIIQEELRFGKDPEDIVVLMRTYAQSAATEERLIRAGIPYRIIGAEPFYRRAEVSAVADHVMIAQAEQRWNKGIKPSSDARKLLLSAWRRASHNPERYLKSADQQEIISAAWGKESLTEVLRRIAKSASSSFGNRENIERVIQQLEWLQARLDHPDGSVIVQGFAQLTGWREELRKRQEGDREASSEERIRHVEALAELIKGHPLSELQTRLQTVRDLAQHDEKGSDAGLGRVTLMSVLRAKGLEWPVVIVPDLNAKLYNVRKPKNGFETEEEITAREEERRLLYVALTRAKERLHLIHDPGTLTPLLAPHQPSVTARAHESLLLDAAPLLELPKHEIQLPRPTSRAPMRGSDAACGKLPEQGEQGPSGGLISFAQARALAYHAGELGHSALHWMSPASKQAFAAALGGESWLNAALRDGEQKH